MTTEIKHEPAETPCDGEWCTQEVPIGVKIGWKERVLRGRDVASAWYVENRLRVWSWARVGAVVLIFIGAAGYAATKMYRWAVKPVSVPTALPDLPKKPASSSTPKAKTGSSGPARPTPKSTKQYDNTRTW